MATTKGKLLLLRAMDEHETKSGHEDDSEEKTSDLEKTLEIGKASEMKTKKMVIVDEVELDGEVFSSPLSWGSEVVVGCRDNFVYSFTVTVGL